MTPTPPLKLRSVQGQATRHTQQWHADHLSVSRYLNAGEFPWPMRLMIHKVSSWTELRFLGVGADVLDTDHNIAEVSPILRNEDPRPAGFILPGQSFRLTAAEETVINYTFFTSDEVL